MTKHQGKNWDLELCTALLAYRTLVKTSMSFTPFSFVYGEEALFPIDVEYPVVKLLEKLLSPIHNAFTKRLLHM